jgi:hypothetical protein
MPMHHALREFTLYRVVIQENGTVCFLRCLAIERLRHAGACQLFPGNRNVSTPLPQMRATVSGTSAGTSPAHPFELRKSNRGGRRCHAHDDTADQLGIDGRAFSVALQPDRRVVENREEARRFVVVQYVGSRQPAAAV